MALERANPLPPGRYSIFVIGPENIAAFNVFLAELSELVKVESSELINPTALEDAKAVKEFIIFRVIAPVPFDQKRFGFPSTAGPDVKSSSDTVQQPDLPPDDAPERLASGVFAVAVAVLVAGAGVGLGYLFFAAKARAAAAKAAA
jgi:hypothetical protein